MTVERLQKIMASRGVASRRRCEELIASGKVKVNGLVASLGDRAQVETDRITIEGWGELSPDTPTLVYLMLNKPRGYVTTVRDQRERPTVLDLVREIPQRIFPVGRLDRDTEGLLLLTNDGALTQRLLHPSGMVQKVYASQAGYAVQVRADGFNGPVVMMVGVSPEGTVLAVSIVSHSETPNLGAVAGDDSAQGRAFRDQYTGMSGTLAVTKDGGQVDAITGATITSRAVTEGINAALACVAGLG